MTSHKIAKVYEKINELVGRVLVDLYEARADLAMGYVGEIEIVVGLNQPSKRLKDLPNFRKFRMLVKENLEHLPGMSCAIHNSGVVQRVMENTNLIEFENLYDVDLCHTIAVETAVLYSNQLERFFVKLLQDNNLDFWESGKVIRAIVTHMTNKPSN